MTIKRFFFPYFPYLSYFSPKPVGKDTNTKIVSNLTLQLFTYFFYLILVIYKNATFFSFHKFINLYHKWTVHKMNSYFTQEFKTYNLFHVKQQSLKKYLFIKYLSSAIKKFMVQYVVRNSQ